MEGIAAKNTEFDEPLKHALEGNFSFVWRSLSKDKEIKEKMEGRTAG